MLKLRWTCRDKPGAESKIAFSNLSKTGGIVNAYRALLIAQKQVMKKPKK